MLTYCVFNSLTFPSNLLILYLVLFCKSIVDVSLNGKGCFSIGKIVKLAVTFILLIGIYLDFILFK